MIFISNSINPNSILCSIKKLLGISEEDTSFDIDIIMNINSALAILNQLGIGPDDGLIIADGTEEWSDFLEARAQEEMAKMYVYLKVRQVFDPPTNSFVIDSMDRQMNELVWRLSIMQQGGSQ